MKKVLVILVLFVMLFSVCACSYVPATRFMSNAKVNSLVKEYGTPQAKVTLSYRYKNVDYKVILTYDLLLSQAPLATIRFIQLANEGYYNDTVIDTLDTSYKYMVMGRYSYVDKSALTDKATYYVNSSDVTFKGEFASNKYKAPKDGYATVENFSLAMYYDGFATDDASFDTANGALVLALDNTLNSNNCAVFAHMVSMGFKIGDSEPVTKPNGGVHPEVYNHLYSFKASSTSKNVYTDDTEKTPLTKVSIMTQLVTIEVEILGNHDWSKLPRIGR